MNLISFEEAKNNVLASAKLFDVISIKGYDALGYVLAEDIGADRHYPPFNRSAMDGFAIRYKDYEKGIKDYKIIGVLFAGEEREFYVQKGECIRIMTGAPVPSGFDCVIKIEDTSSEEYSMTLLPDVKLKSFNNIAKQGEDLQPNEPVLKKGQKINHAAYGLLATLGAAEIKVYKKPSIAIIATGDELKKIDEPVAPYQIRESNSYVLTGLLNSLDIQPEHRLLVVDDKEKMRETLQSVIECDIVILSGGVSMGAADFVPGILQELGVEQVFHKTAIKPGKPIWFGKKDKGVVFALPGNPLSAQVTCRLFVAPYINACMDRKDDKIISLPLKGSKFKKHPLAQFFPVKITENQEVAFLGFNGSGDIKASLDSVGIAHHPADKQELAEGDKLDVYLW